MNKTWITAAACCSCFFMASNVLAATTASPQPFNGAYFGGELGNSMAYANQVGSSNTSLQLETLFLSSNPLATQTKMVRNSFIGALFAGYGHAWNAFYLGGEVTLSDSNYNMRNVVSTGLSQNFANEFTIASTESMTTQVKASPVQVGIFARPGLLLTPNSLLYGRIGLSTPTLQLNTNTSITKQLTVSSQSVINSSHMMQSNSRVHKAVFQIGTGLEQVINDRLSVRLDYLYSYYGTLRTNSSHSSDLSADFNDNLNQLTINCAHSARIQDQSIMLGIAYHLNT